jgi:hypothetical protein
MTPIANDTDGGEVAHGLAQAGVDRGLERHEAARHDGEAHGH